QSHATGPCRVESDRAWVTWKHYSVGNLKVVPQQPIRPAPPAPSRPALLARSLPICRGANLPPHVRLTLRQLGTAPIPNLGGPESSHGPGAPRRAGAGGVCAIIPRRC